MGRLRGTALPAAPRNRVVVTRGSVTGLRPEMLSVNGAVSERGVPDATKVAPRGCSIGTSLPIPATVPSVSRTVPRPGTGVARMVETDSVSPGRGA